MSKIASDISGTCPYLMNHKHGANTVASLSLRRFKFDKSLRISILYWIKYKNRLEFPNILWKPLGISTERRTVLLGQEGGGKVRAGILLSPGEEW